MDIVEKRMFVFGNLFLLANRLQVIGDQYLSGDDMTMKQWFVTVVASQFGDNAPTLTEVAEMMGSSRQNVKQLALKLEEKDFIRIEKDEEDGRATRLKLTEKSQIYWEKRQDQDKQFIKDLFDGFKEEELDVLCSSFNKLLKKIETIGNSKSKMGR